jgi:peptidoglycan-N-acetylglucosamine deacetylase
VDTTVRKWRLGLLLVLVGGALLVAVLGGGDDRDGWARLAISAATKASPQAPLPAATPGALEQAVRDVLAYTSFVARGGGTAREIALTFDDGPGPYTPKVLAALNRHNAKATFFFVGSQERTFHNATIAQIGRGHVVGDHTESHPRLALLPPEAQYAELLAPMQWLSRYGLPRPLLFRPPYGSFNQATLDAGRRLGMLMVMWSLDSRDYVRPGVAAIVDRVVSGARPGTIVLLHDGGGDRSQTVKAIPKIIGRLRARHYHLVTVPELMRDDPPPVGRPPPRVSSEGG